MYARTCRRPAEPSLDGEADESPGGRTTGQRSESAREHEDVPQYLREHHVHTQWVYVDAIYVL